MTRIEYSYPGHAACCSGSDVFTAAQDVTLAEAHEAAQRHYDEQRGIGPIALISVELDDGRELVEDES